MNTPPNDTTPPTNHDGRIFGTGGEPDSFLVGHFWPKLVFFIASLLLLIVAIWELWAPLGRVLTGEKAEARVVRIVRQTPGEPDEVIRIRREIKEGDYAYETIFRHYVEVPDAQGGVKVMQMAVASRQKPYALVNERFPVAYYPDDEYAYATLHHRTWAFGVTLLFMAGTFLPLSWFLLSMVGKHITIDPEDPAQLELERQAAEQERQANNPTPLS